MGCEGEAGKPKTSMTNKIHDKLDEILKDLPPDKLGELNEELHNFMCRSIIALLKDSIAGPGISQQQIEAAREFAELKPDADAAKEVLEFLDNDKVKKAIVSE
jgi:hypothetical protein